jgi:peptidoglycan lytic transglycosylase
VRGLFQFPVAARFIALLGLVGLCADGAMAQSAPQLLLAALDPTHIAAEPVPAHTNLKLFARALAKLETLSPDGDFSAVSDIRTSNLIVQRSAPNTSLWMEIMKSNVIGPVRRARTGAFSTFIAGYNSLSKSLVGTKSLIQKYAAPRPATVIGVASTYNPYRYGIGSGGKQTASGEPYDPAAWTAAIRIDLREQFGGVRYGKNYRPTFALVESGEKCVIVKINDVGPLKPDRVIDLNERSMRYFDPTQQLGLFSDVKVTLLRDDDWTPEPIASENHTITQ